MVNSVCCSYRGPMLGNSHFPVPGDPAPSFGTPKAHGVHKLTQVHAYTHKNIPLVDGCLEIQDLWSVMFHSCLRPRIQTAGSGSWEIKRVGCLSRTAPVWGGGGWFLQGR